MWRSDPPSKVAHLDVDTSGRADGDAVVWDDAGQQHVYGPAGGGGVTLQADRVPGYLNNQWNWNTAAFVQQNVWTHEDGTRYAVWWNDAKRPIIGRLPRGGRRWETFDLGTVAGAPLGTAPQDDIHMQLVVITDPAGIIHVAGNFHDQTWRSVRSTRAGDISGWVSQGAELGGSSSSSYPTFVRLANGEVMAAWREGASGNGDSYVNWWNGTSWSTKLRVVNGVTSSENPYWHRIAVDRSGRIHVFVVWRGTPDANTNRDVSYMRSDDHGRTWRNAAGTAYTLPVTHATIEIVVATASTGSGLINQGGADADANGDPHGAFRLNDGGGQQQIIHVWHDGTGWHDEFVTDFTSGDGPRAALICPASGGTLIVHHRDGWVRGIDVTVPGQPRGMRLHRADIQGWEISIDSGAARFEDRLAFLLSDHMTSSSDPDFVRKVAHVLSSPASVLADEAAIGAAP